jgi:hypothetical protein
MVSEKINMVPGADFVIKDGDVLVMVGKEKDIQQIQWIFPELFQNDRGIDRDRPLFDKT